MKLLFDKFKKCVIWALLYLGGGRLCELCDKSVSLEFTAFFFRLPNLRSREISCFSFLSEASRLFYCDENLVCRTS